MAGLVFDWTINIGQIGVLLGVCGTVVVFTLRLIGHIGSLDARVGELEGAMRQQIGVLVKVAESSVQITSMEKREQLIIANYNERLAVHNLRIAALESSRSSWKGSPQ